MKAIVLCFTLKGQEFSRIATAITAIKEQLKESGNDEIMLIHGFMPRQEVIDRSFSTEVVDFLESNFPVRTNMYNEKPLRQEMADLAKSLNATIYAIGETKEGVAEEVDLYKSLGLEIIEISIKMKTEVTVKFDDEQWLLNFDGNQYSGESKRNLPYLSSVITVLEDALEQAKSQANPNGMAGTSESAVS